MKESTIIEIKNINLIKIPLFLNPILNSSITKKIFLNFFYIIYNSLVYFVYKIFNYNLFHFYNQNVDFNCSWCNSNSVKSCYFVRVRPSVDVKILNKELFKKFYFKSIGTCSNCNLTQDYNRPTKKNIDSFVKIFKSKDDLISENLWHSWPICPKELNKYYFKIYKKKFTKWKTSINFSPPPKKILFLRPTFGFDIQYFKNNFKNIECYFSEVSEISQKYILNKYSDLKKIELNIDRLYYGDFDKYNNFFDLIISEHNLVHVYYLKDSLSKISNLLIDGGKVIFSNEISIKPKNLFHKNFYDEKIFTEILNHFFKDIKRLDCGHKEKSTINYTLNKDNPSFICTK